MQGYKRSRSNYCKNNFGLLAFFGRWGMRCDEAALSADVRLVSWALRSSSSIRHIPLTNASRLRRPVEDGSQSFHMSRSLPRSSFEALQTSLTIRPPSLSSGPTGSKSVSSSSSLSVSLEGIIGRSSGLVIRSTESPLQPAACLLFFTDNVDDGGDFGLAFLATFRRLITVATNKAS